MCSKKPMIRNVTCKYSSYNINNLSRLEYLLLIISIFFTGSVHHNFYYCNAISLILITFKSSLLSRIIQFCGTCWQKKIFNSMFQGNLSPYLTHYWVLSVQISSLSPPPNWDFMCFHSILLICFSSVICSTSKAMLWHGSVGVWTEQAKQATAKLRRGPVSLYISMKAFL